MKTQMQGRQDALLVAALVHFLPGDGIARDAVPQVHRVGQPLPLGLAVADKALEQVELGVLLRAWRKGVGAAPPVRGPGQPRLFFRLRGFGRGVGVRR